MRTNDANFSCALCNSQLTRFCKTGMEDHAEGRCFAAVEGGHNYSVLGQKCVIVSEQRRKGLTIIDSERVYFRP